MSDKNKSSRNNFDKTYDEFRQARVEFSNQALAEVMTFLKNDNRIVSAYADIVETIRDELKENPSKISSDGVKIGSAAGDDCIKGAGVLDDFIGAHVDIILADKELAWKLIDRLLPPPLPVVPPIPPLPPIPDPSSIGGFFDSLNPFKW